MPVRHHHHRPSRAQHLPHFYPLIRALDPPEGDLLIRGVQVYRRLDSVPSKSGMICMFDFIERVLTFFSGVFVCRVTPKNQMSPA